MKSEFNPLRRSALLVTSVAAIGLACTTQAANYNFGAVTADFTIQLSDMARVQGVGTSSGTFDSSGSGSVYDRGANQDATYMHFDLAPLAGTTMIGNVNLNLTVDTTWGGGLYAGIIGTANGAWSAANGSTAPGMSPFTSVSAPNALYTNGQTATWTISATTFSEILGNLAHFNGFAVTAGDGSQAHFTSAATLTGSCSAGAIRVTDGTDWSAASWDDGSKTLSISGSSNVSGGNVSLVAGSTLTLGGSATLDGGNFSGTMANNGSLIMGSSANHTLAGIISGGGGLTKSGSGTLVLSAVNTYTGGTTVHSGILELAGSTGGTGRIRGPLIVNPGAEVRLSGGDGTGFGWNDARISSLTINGGAVHSAGTLHIWNLAGGVNLTGGSLSSNGGASTTAGPQLEWANTTLTSNASADTALVAGRINIRRDAASLLQVNVADGAAATDLLISAALTESASGCGLAKSGTGTLKLTGAVQLTGLITVNAGTLDLSSATLTAGVRINVLSGARFIPPSSGLPASAIIYVNGAKLAPGTWGSLGSVVASLAQYESPALAGSTVVTVPDTGISNRERFKTLKYGVFSHYNYWATGNGDVNDAANAFNAEKYADDLATAGVQYVVWTAWHGNMFPMFPSQAAAKYGYGSRCSTRDTVSDMIDAVKARGIRVFLYTHPYQPLTYDLAHHNNFINELYAETVDRYGSRIDGLWIDENMIDSSQDSVVDYKRLMATIKEHNPDLVTMQNGWQLYTVDTGGNESVGSWNFGQSQPVYCLVSGQGVSPEDMWRTTVLQAAANFDGGGIHLSIDGVAYAGLAETTRIFQVGSYLAPIRASICETKPSTSFPPPYNGNSVSYNSVNWVATTSTDETKEFIHVLKAPTGNTLTLPATADGKVFSAATLMASLQTGAATQQYLGTPVAMIQTPRGIQLTLPSGASWSSLDTVIQLDVASKGGAGMVNDTSAAITYTGSSWSYQNHRGAGEYNDDAHVATANGDSFTFTFSGTDVEYIATRAADRGPVAIYIDDVLQTTVDLSVGAPLGSRQSVFAKSGLARGTHTLKAVKMGGTYMDADGFKVTELINDSDPDLNGAFLTTLDYGTGSAGYGGPSNSWQPGYNGANWITPAIAHYPNGEPLSSPLANEPVSEYFDFTFTGTGVQIPLSSAYSWAYFYMKVDGVYHSNVQVSQGQVSTFSVSGLAPGTHTIRGIAWKSVSDPSQPGVNGFTVTRPGIWTAASGRGYGEIGDDVHYTDTNPGRFSWNFNGSGVEVITTRDSDARIAYFSVSGMDRSMGARYNNYSPTRQTGTSVFQRPNLAPGSYSVSVSHAANTSGMNFSFARLAIDALRVYKGESMASAPLYWGASGNGGSGTWDVGTSANWYDGGQATAWYDFGGTDYRAVFGGSAGSVNLASGIKANRLSFASSGYTLSGSALTLSGSNPTIDTAAGVTTTFATAPVATNGLVKSGSGTLQVPSLSGDPANLTLSAGTIQLTGGHNNYWGVLNTVVAAGAKLSNNTHSHIRNLHLQGGELATTGVDSFWGSWMLDNDVIVSGATTSIISASRVAIANGSGIARVFDVAADSTLDVTGFFENANTTTSNGLTKNGAGTMILRGNNTYNGTTTVNAGKLLIMGSVANTSTVTIAAGATLEISGTLASSAQIVNSGTLLLTGNPQLSAANGIINYGSIINSSSSFVLPSNIVNYGTILTLPSAPSGLTATPSGTSAVLGWSAVSGATSYRVKQSTSASGPFSVVASPTTNSSSVSGLVAGMTYYFTVSAVNSLGEGANSATASCVIGALPAPWVTADVGTVGLAGSATTINGIYTVRGSGTGVYASTDQCRMVYQTCSGDCDMVARVDSLTNPSVSAKVGVMIRESRATNARCAGVYVTPTSGVQFIWRTSAGSMPSIATVTGLTAPRWVRIQRVGSSFRAYHSTNGTTWTQFGGNKTISMSTNAIMGQVVTSGNNSALATGVFSGVVATP